MWGVELPGASERPTLLANEHAFGGEFLDDGGNWVIDDKVANIKGCKLSLFSSKNLRSQFGGNYGVSEIQAPAGDAQPAHTSSMIEHMR